MTRWFRPPELERAGARAAFDPILEGRRHGLAPGRSLALWQRAITEATSRSGHVAHEIAHQRFHALALQHAAPVSAIGRSTRVATELPDGPAPPRTAALAGTQAVGRSTRVAAMAERELPSDAAMVDGGLPEIAGELELLHGPRLPLGHRADPWTRGLLSRGSAGRPGGVLAVVAGRSTVARSNRAAGSALGPRISRDAEPGQPDVAPDQLVTLLPILDDARGGEPLPAALARQLAGELGMDLARVRIHTDDRAARLAVGLGARAFAIGDDIYFARGTYDPETAAGRRLIAHEVMHIVQHARGAVPDSGRVVSSPDDAHERQAEAFAHRFVFAPVAAPAIGATAPAPAATAARGSAPRIDRSAEPGSNDRMWQQIFRGASVPVDKLARVSAAKGIRLHDRPLPGAAKAAAIIPFGELVYVERTTPEAELAKRWSYVIVIASGATGLIEEKFLAIDPPEPGATLHAVKPSENLGQIAQQAYGASFATGNDARLYVQALYEANKHQPGIRLQPVSLSATDSLDRQQAEQETLKIYRGVQVLAGQAIWIPSEGFVQRLKASGAVSSGSTEFTKVFGSVKDLTAGIPDDVKFQAGVVVGILEGAWQALVDVFKGAWELVKMAFEVMKAYVTGTLLELLIDTAQKIRAFFAKLDVGKLVQAFGKYLADKWTKNGWFGRGEFVGQIVGYIALNVLLVVATEGGSLGALLAESAAAGSDVARAVMALIKVIDAAQNPLKVLEGAGKGVVFSEEVAAKLKQGLAHDAVAAGKAGVKDAGKAVEHAGASTVAKDAGAGERARGMQHGGDGNTHGAGADTKTETHTRSIDDLPHDRREFHNIFKNLSPEAQQMVRQLEEHGWATTDKIHPYDLAEISKWFGKEIGVVQSPYGQLRLVLGTTDGVLTKQLLPGEVFVVHTHPVMKSMDHHFNIDLPNASDRVEAVVDWGGQMTYFDKSGIKNPIRPDHSVAPLHDYQAAFLDADGHIVGFGKIDVTDSAAGAVIKVTR